MTDILVFGAHPDDIEFSCGGILAKMALQGKSIVMCDLTLGDKGTNGTIETRKQESINAAAVIGAKRIFLDFKDCEIVDSYENRLKLVEVIRVHKPKLVIAPLWKGEANHPDHLACGILARYACRYARFGKILPEIPPHRVGGILHYLNFFSQTGDFYVDISSVLETWKKMIYAHESQTNTFPYQEWNMRVASGWGVVADCAYAQGLVHGNPIIIDDVMSLANQAREI